MERRERSEIRAGPVIHPSDESASIALSSLRNGRRQRKTLRGQFIPLALDLVDSVSLAHACTLDKNVHFV